MAYATDDYTIDENGTDLVPSSAPSHWGGVRGSFVVPDSPEIRVGPPGVTFATGHQLQAGERVNLRPEDGPLVGITNTGTSADVNVLWAGV